MAEPSDWLGGRATGWKCMTHNPSGKPVPSELHLYVMQLVCHSGFPNLIRYTIRFREACVADSLFRF